MIIRDVKDLSKVMSLLNRGWDFVYDIETDSLNVRKGKIIGFGIANMSSLEAAYVVLKEWNGSELVDVISREAALPILERLKTKKLCGWNYSFDSRFTYHYFGVELWDSLAFEPMLALHTLDENRFSYGLKDVAAELLGAESKDSQVAMKASIAENGGSKNEYFKASSALMAEYGLQDVIMTAKLANMFKARLKTDGLEKFYYEEPLELYKTVTIPLELFGIPVDTAYIERSHKAICIDLDAIEESIQAQIKPLLGVFNEWFLKKDFPFKLSGETRQLLAEMYPVANWPKTDNSNYSFSKVDYNKAVKKGLIEADNQLEKWTITLSESVPKNVQHEVSLELLRRQGTKYTFNLLSKFHLKKLFFDTLGEKALSHTDKGAPQVDDNFLDEMALKYQWAAELQTFNKLTKIKGTYHERFLNEAEDGIFYPSYHQHRTTSGRYSGDMQQLPRKKNEDEMPNELVRKYTNEIRDFFISGEGYKLIDADYSSLEVVVFADDANDEALLDIIRKGLDFYSQVAISVYKLEGYSADKSAPNFLKKHRPELRQQAKAFALGIRYGLGSFKLSKELNITQEEAELIVKGYLSAFPQLAKRMEELKNSAITKGFVQTKSGRVRHLGQLKELIEKHGPCLLNSLELWKQYGDSGSYYNFVKMQGRVARNLLNNSLNQPIQGYAASIVSRASIVLAKELKAKGLKSRICLSQHDELALLAPDNEIEEASEIMQRCMETTTLLSVPLQAEPQVGQRYGDVK